MKRTLQQEIADYNQMVETTRQDGRCLRQRLEKEGWKMLTEDVYDFDNIAMVSPELLAKEEWNLRFFDDEGRLCLQDVIDALDNWSDHIIEIPVTD
jgi:hypothetical protein